MRSNPQPQIMWLFAAICGLSVIILGGCVHPAARAGRDADASMAAFRTDLHDLNAALIQARTDIRAGRDVQHNDAWTMRLMGLGLALLGLSYPVGKLIWLAMIGIKDRASAAHMMPMSGKPARDRSNTVQIA